MEMEEIQVRESVEALDAPYCPACYEDAHQGVCPNLTRTGDD